ncbi:hypothetical protein KC726_03320 [Candidatus Woesebacteria bacterium]|nr:hypothetical protein [Candidatus Woesebacteria bacterium]
MKIPVKLIDFDTILVESGQKVDQKTPFYKAKGTKTVTIPLAELLHFEPTKIFHALKKLVGDTVKKGDLLAEHKKTLSTRQYFSEFDGTILEIDHVGGGIKLEIVDDNENIVYCFFNGEIDTVHDDHVELKVQRAERFSAKQLNNQTGGAVFYLEDPTTLDEEYIADRLIVLKNEIDPMTQAKIEALGAKGYITGAPYDFKTTIQTIVIPEEKDMSRIQETKHSHMLVNPDEDVVYFYTA